MFIYILTIQSFVDNKTQRLAENHDKRISLSFSQNNVIINTPTVIQHKTYFRSNTVKDDMNYNLNSSKYTLNNIYLYFTLGIKKYTFDTYRNNLSYNY